MRSQLFAVLLLVVTPVLSVPTPGNDKNDDDCDIRVNYPDSIQAAIDKAKPGDKIIVEKGTYKEQLTITKNGIHLIGKNAVLVPPTPYKNNFCSGLSVDFPPPNGTGLPTEAGICIYNKDTNLAPYQRELQHRKIASMGDYIKDVTIRGFKVEGFNGENIAVIGGQDTRISNNQLIGGYQYGFLTVGSKHTVANNNIVTITPFGFIGMCMDDKADAKFKENEVSGYLIGLCGETSGGLMKRNKVSDNCIGSFIDPGVKGLKIIENTFSGHGKFCPPEFASGLVIQGAQDAQVLRNTFKNIKNDPGKPPGTAIFVDNDAATGLKATGNVFKENVFVDNDFDIFVNFTEPVNTFKGNKCSKGSVPASACTS